MVKRFLLVNCFFERSNLRILASMAEIIAKYDRWSCNQQTLTSGGDVLQETLGH
jgi:flagellar basal body rod protein FlgG